MGTEYELKNRYLHLDYFAKEEIQSAKNLISKCQNGTLDDVSKISSDQLVLLKKIIDNPVITQMQLAKELGKSVRTIKREMSEFKEKGYIKRINGKRNGQWEVLVKIKN